MMSIINKLGYNASTDRASILKKHVHFVLQAVLFASIVFVVWFPIGQLLRRRAFWIAIALLLVLNFGEKSVKRVSHRVLLSLLVILPSTYVVVNYDHIMRSFASPTTLELLFGTAIVLAAIEGTRRSMESAGKALATLTVFFVLFALFGHLIPGRFGHSQISFGQLVDMTVLGTQGMYGFILGTVVSYVVPFIIFGKALETLGATEYIVNTSEIFTSRMSAGTPKLAVAASALMGTLSGTVIGNIATTGSITIPAMKESGMTDEDAAAVESVASTGGQIMPPVMGIAIFIMINIIGIPYIEMIARAAVPAAFFFTMVFFYIHLAGKKGNFRASGESEVFKGLPSKRWVAKYSYYFLSIVVIVVLLANGFSVPRTGLIASAFLVVSGMIFPRSRLSVGRAVEIIQESMKLSAKLIVITASLGIILGIVGSTGIQLKITSLMLGLGGENVIIILILTMFASILVGMGISSTVVAYIILATLIAPALTEIGFKTVAAHLFVFYFGMFALITPPVGLGLFTAASMSGGDPYKAGIKAMQIALPGFLLPYLFLMNPELLLYGTPVEIVVTVALTGIALSAVTIAQVGYFLRDLALVERLGFFGVAIGAVFFLI
jgi:TRAP transporter 4TM/12TM fusion protein